MPLGVVWGTDRHDADDGDRPPSRWLHRSLVVWGLALAVAAGGAAALAHWVSGVGASVGLGSGDLALTAAPAAAEGFSFDCVASPASCSPASVTRSRTFTNSGTIPAAVYLEWATLDDTHCSLFDVIVEVGGVHKFSGHLCDLLALTDGVQVSAQVDPGAAVTADITVTPEPDDPAWACPVTVNLASTTTWGQWDATPPGSYGWWDASAAEPFAIQMTPGQATLTVVKHVDNTGGGTAVAGDWTMDITATNPTANHFPGEESPGTAITIDAGAFAVGESGGPAGYTATYEGCDDVAVGGGSYTCTITNTYVPATKATLTIIKQVVGGPAEAHDWTMDVTAVNPSANHFPGAEAPGQSITIDAGAFSVTESGGPADYSASYSDCSGTAVAGGTYTCTITNTYTKATLTVIKEVDNTGGGTAEPHDWTMNVTAVNPSQSSFPGAGAPGTPVTIDPGAYSVSESGGPAHYVASPSAECSGTAVAGGTYTCTITNTWSAATLTVVKHVVNTGGGTAVSADWTMNVSATNPSQSSFPGADTPGTELLIDPGAFTVTESAGPANYTPSTSGTCSGTAVAGGAYTCTYTNTYVRPNSATLVVVKHVNNTAGGTLAASDFVLTVTGGNPDPATFSGREAGRSVVINAGTAYSVSEAPQTGYVATYSTACSSTTGLAVGSTATCTVTNTFVAPVTLSCPGKISVTLDRLTGNFTVTNLSAGAYNALRLWGSPASSAHWGSWSNGYPLGVPGAYPTGTPWLNCRGNLAAGASCSGTQPPPMMQYVMVSSGAAGQFTELCILDFGIPPTFLSRTTTPITFQMDRMTGHFLVWNIGAVTLNNLAIYDNATGVAPWGTAWTQCAGNLLANTICNNQTSPVPIDRYVRVAWTGGEVVLDFGP